VNIHTRVGRGLFVAVALILATIPAGRAAADEDINCSNEFRSGKLYFSPDQALYEKARDSFARAAGACPEKGEYRARYAMALCECGKLYTSNLLGATPEAADTLTARIKEFYGLAGSEFEAALQTEDGKKKKLQNFVDDNRTHYWVEVYNDALKLTEDGSFADADVRFQDARLLNPNDIRAYQQGVIPLIKMGKKEDALALVETGLLIEPQDEKLNQLKMNITHGMAADLIDRAETEENADFLKQAIVMYQQLLEKSPDDPNLIYELGLAELTGAELVGKDDEAARAALYGDSVLHFRKAADLVPADGDNRDFHVNCIFYIAQALTSAGKVDEALAAAREYVCLSPLDPLGWQFVVVNLLDKQDQAGVVSSLMMKKSLDPQVGQEIPVEGATDAASGPIQEALAANGKPDHVYTYQQDNTQIQTWVWLGHKKATVFTLASPPEKSGELTWCSE